jgi:hypothetical protein
MRRQYSLHNHLVHGSIIMNRLITKYRGAVGLILLGLALQSYAVSALGSATSKFGAPMASFTSANGSPLSRRDPTRGSQTGQITIAGEDRSDERIDIDMDDDASASPHFSQTSHPAHKANLWLAQSGYLPNDSGRSLREPGPPVSRI